MDVKHLEFFLRVFELGSINRAAPTIGLSQPALSRHISSLEHELRTPLFARSQSGVRPTEAGQLLADRSRPLLRQLALLKQQVGERAAGQVAIGTPPAWQMLLTTPFIEAMTEGSPGVRLRVYEGLSNVLREDMAGGLLDMAIAPFSTAPIVGYQQRAVVREPLIVVGRAGDRLDPAKPATLSNLRGRSLVLPERPNALRTQLERSLERTGITLRLAVETDTLAICVEMARRGVGWSVMPASAIYGQAGDKTISWTALKAQYVTWALWENISRTHSQAVREARTLLMKQIDRAVTTGGWFGAVRVPGRLLTDQGP